MSCRITFGAGMTRNQREDRRAEVPRQEGTKLSDERR